MSRITGNSFVFRQKAGERDLTSRLRPSPYLYREPSGGGVAGDGRGRQSVDPVSRLRSPSPAFRGLAFPVHASASVRSGAFVSHVCNKIKRLFYNLKRLFLLILLSLFCSTFSISRAQSRTCSGYAEARKQSEKIQLLTERSYVRTFVFTSRFPRSVYVAGNLYRNRSGVFVVGGGLSASGSTVDGVRRGTRFRSVVGIG